MPTAGRWSASRTCARSAVVALALLALPVLLAGCGGSSHPSGPIGGAIDHRDEAHWSMPVDAFRIDIPRLEYAEDILIGRCMRARRIPWPTPVLKHVPPGCNGPYATLFTLPLARQYGYSGGPPVTTDPTPPPLTPATRRACTLDPIATSP